MRTHSAAPWDRVRIGTTGDGQNRDHDVYCVNSAKGHEIAYGLREMDARLISAAPDLLEALQLALKGLRLAAETSPERDDEAWLGYVLSHDKAVAAILKATGENA